MKRFKHLILTLLVLGIALLPALPVFAQDNLMPNASVETASGDQPANWHGDHWGNNTVSLAYANEGQDGNKSLRIDMAQHTDGDAKWMSDPVNVSGNQTYAYGSYYKSNVDTEIDLQYTHADGSASYAFVQAVPTSNDWQQVTTEFTTPATATKVVVMHIIAQAGWLQTDSFALAVKAPTPPPAENDNLIANASFEDTLVGSPINWNKNAWGDIQAQFTYASTGRTGSRSATVAVTQQTSGDAKWFAQPVQVQAGKSYVYRDYYKATRATRVVVAYLDAAGAWSYSELAGAPVANDWVQYQANITVPANAVQATVFHLIDGVGTLTIDDVLLQVAAPVSTAPVIPNASLETANAGQPAQWQHNSWGANTASFAYANEGRTGGKSAKVTVSNYTDGDAKWFFEPITTLTPGKQYRFTAWYKTNTLPQATAMFIKADGTESYVSMPAPQPAAGSDSQWQQYSDTFMVPADAVSVSAFLYINHNGWLQTDDYSLADYHPNGFSRPLLTLTFDDGHEDNVNTALPLLNQYGYKTTQCFATTFVEGIPQAVSNVKAFQNSGHEICSHTVTHPFLTTLNSTQLNYELQHSRQYLESITGTSVEDFATPYGDYNPTVNAAIKQYYASHRTVDEGFNSKDNFDRYRLRVQNILDTTTAAQVQQWIEQAQADKTWLILVYHRVASDPGPYDSYTTVFAQHLQAISQSGITVETYRDALAEVSSQL